MQTYSLDNLDGFAVDFGGTKTAIARFNKGIVCGRKQVLTDGSSDVNRQLDVIENLLIELGYDGRHKVGIGVTGRIDVNGTWYVVNKDTLPSFVEFPLEQELLRRIGPRFSLLNDACAAALGEARFGAGRNLASVGYITVSTGVGGGIVLDGNPIVSKNGLAGHVGFVSSKKASLKCGCGRVGTVESIASGRAIANAAYSAGFTGLDAKEVFFHARNGEKWAESIIGLSAEAVADLCANLSAILGLEKIIIGGSVGLAEGYVERVRACLVQEPDLFNTSVVPAELGQNSVLYGALSMTVSN